MPDSDLIMLYVSLNKIYIWLKSGDGKAQKPAAKS